MSNYELASTVISSLSLAATIFFGWQVYKLTKKANEIAEESVNIQKRQIEININKKVDEHYFTNKFEAQKKETFYELEKEADFSFSQYEELLKFSKRNEEETKKQIKEIIEELQIESGKKTS